MAAVNVCGGIKFVEANFKATGTTIELIKAENQKDSTATTVELLLADFNTLLTKLKDAGLMVADAE